MRLALLSPLATRIVAEYEPGTIALKTRVSLSVRGLTLPVRATCSQLGSDCPTGVPTTMPATRELDQVICKVLVSLEGSFGNAEKLIEVALRWSPAVLPPPLPPQADRA